ncbi:hemagglutinin repeat-containing protein [Terasakiella sp.]|uniref:two-partner secretion domain-containing protein n=1 Tax=Terasakiella sp. TaxID=2034861 RepID=UPI003AA9C26E
MKLFFRNTLCWLLSLLITLQPNIVQAQQANITLEAGSGGSVDQTFNGTPLLNITGPNASGISHNKFTDFNVGSKGLVINNALENTTSQIGGALLANPNLQGNAARLILNEVTSANRTRLDGFSEIAGQKADYILANPNGITCNGCGFINTSRTTLTTGVPVFNGSQLESLSVDRGNIIVEGLGLNARDTDAFDLITRAAQISGAIHAKELNVITGRNDVAYADRATTAKTDDAHPKPSLAIDSSALGGMYAGRISLLATEKGVGVNMQGDMAATSGDLTLTADGRIEFNKIAAQNDVTLSAQNNNTIKNKGSLYSGRDLKVSGGTIETQNAVMAAKNNVTLNGQSLEVQNGEIVAGRLEDGSNTASGKLDVTTQNAVNLEGGRLQAAKTATLKVGSLSDGSGSNGIQANGDLNIDAQHALTLKGVLQTKGNLKATATDLNLHDTQAQGNTTLNATGHMTLSSHVQSRQKTTINTGNLQAHQITSGDDLDITATHTANLNGKVKTNTSLNVTGENVQALDMESVQGLTLDGTSSLRTTQLRTGGDLQLSGGAITLQEGTIETGGTTTVSATSIQSKATLKSSKDIRLTSTQETNVQEGSSVASSGTLSIQAQTIQNAGTLSSQSGTTLTASQSIDTTATSKIESAAQTRLVATGDIFNAGTTTAQTNLSLKARNLINSGTLTDGSTDGLTLELSGDLTHNGLIQSIGDLSLKLDGQIAGTGGAFKAVNDLTLEATNIDVHDMDFSALGKGTLIAQANLSWSGDIATTESFKASGQNLTLNGKLDSTQDATLSADNTLTLGANSTIATDLTLTGDSLHVANANIGGKATFTGNRYSGSGNLEAGGSIKITTSEDLNQNTGRIVSDKQLELTSTGGNITTNATLSGKTGTSLNANKAIQTGSNTKVQSGDSTTITAGTTLTNDGLLSAMGNVVLSAKNMINNAVLAAGKSLGFTITETATQNGTVYGQEGVSLSATTLNGTSGLWESRGNIILSATNINVSDMDLTSLGTTTLSATEDLSWSGDIATVQTFKASGQNLTLNGTLDSTQDATLSATNALTLGANSTIATDLTLNGSTIQVANANIGGKATFTGKSYSGSGNLEAGDTIKITTTEDLSQNTGRIISEKQLELTSTGGKITTDATLSAKTGITLDANQNIDIAANGIIKGNGITTLKAGTTVNNAGRISAVRAIDITAIDLLNNGAILTGDQLGLNLNQSLTNNAVLYSHGSLNLSTNTINGTGGSWESDSDITLNATNINVSDMDLTSLGTTTLSTTGDLSWSGDLFTEQNFTATGDNLHLSGQLQANKNATLTATNAAILDASALIGENLTIRGTDLSLADAGVRGTTTLSGTTYSGTGTVETLNDITITTTGALHQKSGTLKTDTLLTLASTGGTLTSDGILSGKTGVNLTAQKNIEIGETAGVHSDGSITLKSTETLTNAGKISALKDLSFTAKNMVNNARITADQDLKLTIEETTTNTGLLHGFENLTVDTTTLQGADGTWESAKDILIEADTINVSNATLISQGHTTLTATDALNWSGDIDVSKTLNATGDSLSLQGMLDVIDNVILSATNTLDLGATTKLGKNLNITAKDISLANASMAGALTIESDIYRGTGEVGANGDITITTSGTLAQNSGDLNSNQHLKLTSTGGDITTNATLSGLNGTTIKADQAISLGANAIVKSGTLENATTTSISAGTGLTNNGLISSMGDVVLQAKEIINNLSVASVKALNLEATQEITNNATLFGNDSLSATAPNITGNNGTWESNEDVSLSATTLNLSNTTLNSKGTTTLTATGALNWSGELNITKGLTATGDTLNLQGTLDVGQNATLTATNGATLGATSAIGGDLTITGTDLVLASAGVQNNVTLSGTTYTGNGDLNANGDISITTSRDLTQNTGQIVSDKTLNLTSSQANITTNGILSAQTGLTLDAHQDLTIDANGTAQSGSTETQATTTLSAGTTLTNNGLISAIGDIVLNIKDMVNNASVIAIKTLGFNGAENVTNNGTFYGKDALTLNAAQIRGNNGRWESEKDITLSATDFNLTNTALTALGNGSLTASGALNWAGRQRVAKNLTLNANTLNQQGTLDVGQDTTLEIANAATLSATATIGGALDISARALVMGTADVNGAVTLTATTYTGNGDLDAGGNLSLTTSADQNQTIGRMVSEGQLNLTSTGGNITTNAILSGKTATTLDAHLAINVQENGKVQSGAAATLAAGTTIDNKGFITAQDTLTLNTTHVTNSGSMGANGLTFTLSGDLTNTGTLYSKDHLTFKLPGTLLNDEGNLIANGDIQIDADGTGTKNTKVWNYSGLIESTNGGISINTQELLNERKGLVETNKLKSSNSTKTVYTSQRLGNTIAIGSGDKARYINQYWVSFGEQGDFQYVDFYKFADILTYEYSATSTQPIPKIISLQNLNILATTTTNSSGWIHSNQDILLTGQTLNNIGHTHSEKIIESGSYADGTYWAGSGGEGSIYDIRVLNLPTTEKSTITDPGDTFITAGGNITGDFTGQIDNISIFGGADPKTITGGNMDLARTSASLNAPQNAQTTAGSDAQNAQRANTTGPADVTTTGDSQTQAADNANLTGPNGGTINTTAQGAENTDVDAPSSLTTQNTAQGAQDADLNNPGENNLQNNQPFRATTADLQAAQAPTPAPAINVHATAPDIGLPSPEDLNAVFELPTGNGALFVQSKDPQANFILESNPVMNDLGALFSSDYFTQRANLSLDQEFIRLGDKDWETRQVRDQIMAVTHKRFLNDQITSDSDQYKTLMDNALAQHKELDLSYGIALSQEQIGALTQDMVWMVETELNDGRTAVRPVVYLAEASRAQIDSSGASIIARGDLNLTSGDDFANSGTLKGTNVALTSKTGSFTNTYGKVQATDTLSITAQEDIINTGGLILGKDVTLSATNGDFIQTTETWRQSETTVDHYQGVWGNTKSIAFNDIAGPRANVRALGGNLTIKSKGDITDSGAGTFSADGNLTLDAGGTISLASLTTRTRDYGLGEYKIDGVQRSTELTSTLWSGGDMTLNSGEQSLLFGTKATAGGDLSINSTTDTFLSAVQNNTLTDRGNWGFGRRWSSAVQNDLAELKAGGSLSITSGQDTSIKGAALDADGALALTSGGNTLITGVQDTFKKDIVGKKYELHIDKRDTISSSLNAGDNLTIKSNKNLDIAGSTITAEKSIDLQADENINITNLQNVDIRKEWTSKKGFISSSSTTSEAYKEQSVSSNIGAGENISIRAANDVTITASNVEATGDLSVQAEKDLSITSAEDLSYTSRTTRKSSGINLGIVSYNSLKGTANKNQQVNTITSNLQGENVDLTSGADLGIKGSQVIAANDATLNVGGNLNIENASNTKESSSSNFKSSSFSATLPVYFFDVNLGYNSAKTKSDNVYDKTVVASRVVTGNDLNVNVGEDANITGSDVQAGGDLNVKVTGDLGLATAQNVHNESHSESKQSGFSIGVSYNGFGVNLAQSKLKGTENSTLDVLNEGSLLKAGGDLNVAANNVTMISGELTSGNGTNLEATNDITLATAQDIHQTSTSTISGKTNSVGVSYGKGVSDSVNLNVGANVSKGTFTTNTHTVTDTIQQGTDITAGNNINVTSGADTKLVNADLNAGGDTTVTTGGAVNLLAAADIRETTDTTKTTKTSSVGVTVGASLNYENGGKDSTFGSIDGKFTTGNLSVGVTQTKSKTTTTETTTTETTYKGTNLTSGGTTTIVAVNDIEVENTETTGKVLSTDDVVSTGGTLNETTVEDMVETVSTTTTTSTSSTKVTGPDLKQFALDTVGNAVGEMGANKIGDMKEKGDVSEGGGKILHALNGAVKGAISAGGKLEGAAAGAVGAVVGEIAADITGDIVSKDDEERSKKITYAATTAAMIAANLLGQDSNIAQGAASNAVENNRLLHTAEVLAIEKTAEEMAVANKDNKDPEKRTKAYWLTELGNEALRQVDAEKARELGPNNDEALAILETIDHYEQGFMDKFGNQLKFLAKDDQFTNPSLFASTVMANKGFYDVVLKDYTPAGFENLKGVVSGSTLAISNALKEVTKSSSVVGGGDELYLSDEERINRTLELVETSKQIYQVKQELKQKRSDPEGKLSADQKSELFLLNDGLELTKTKVVSGITQTMQKGFNQGAAKFVAENAEAVGLLLYDTMTPAQLLDGDAATRNKERIDGVVYLLKNWDTLPEQIADDFKSTMVKAKEKLDAGDHVGGMEIYGELTAKLGSSALSGLKLSSDIAGALGKIGGKVEFEIHPRVVNQLNDQRMGSLRGKLSNDDLQRLVNTPNATRVLDNRSGHINVIQEIEGKIIRITVPRDSFKIISVGPIRENQVKNLINKGDFTPLK